MMQYALPLAGQVLGGILGRKKNKDPYASQRNDILARAKAVSERSADESIAGFTPLQQQAFEGIGSLAYTPAEYTRQSFTDPGVAQKYMSPYERGVADIAKRQFKEEADIAAQQTAARAVQAGAFGGDRYGLVEAKMAKDRQQGLADIDAKSLQAAYDAAQKQFGFEAGQEQQRQYLQDLADRFGFGAERSILGDQMRAGGMQQDLEQKYLSYPQTALQDYASIFNKTVTQAPSTTDWGSTGAGIGGLLGKYIEGKGGIGNLFAGTSVGSEVSRLGSSMGPFSDYTMGTGGWGNYGE